MTPWLLWFRDVVSAALAFNRTVSGQFAFRSGTETERANAIAAARERILNLERQPSPLQHDGANPLNLAIAFEHQLIKRLERGDAFAVPDVAK